MSLRGALVFSRSSLLITGDCFVGKNKCPPRKDIMRIAIPVTIEFMLRIEFHCHTHASKDSLTPPADLIAAARRKGIDRLIITDHNTIAGARAAQALDPELVIVGEEIMTTRGEILAAFVTEEIPPSLSPTETIRRLKDQGAFISVSHPFDKFRLGGWKEDDLLEILPQVDAIEVYNSRCMFPGFNRAARKFAESIISREQSARMRMQRSKWDAASLCWSSLKVQMRCGRSSVGESRK